MRRTLLLATETLRGWQRSSSGACLAACGSRAASQPTSATLGRAAASVGATHCPSAAAQSPPSCTRWASTAAAATAGDDGAAAASSQAPCERGPEAQAANELDRQLAAAAQAGGPAAVLELVEEQGERFTELNVISALEALGGSQGSSGMSGVELVRSRPFQTLVDMLLAGLQRFEPTLLAQAVHHCGRLGASEEMLLDEVGRHIMKHIDALSAADVAALVGGLAALDHSPSSVLFDALAGRAEELRGQFSQEQRQVVAEGYRALGYAAKAPRLD